jgi:hypothetical protein
MKNIRQQRMTCIFLIGFFALAVFLYGGNQVFGQSKDKDATPPTPEKPPPSTGATGRSVEGRIIREDNEARRREKERAEAEKRRKLELEQRSKELERLREETDRPSTKLAPSEPTKPPATTGGTGVVPPNPSKPPPTTGDVAIPPPVM